MRAGIDGDPGQWRCLARAGRGQVETVRFSQEEAADYRDRNGTLRFEEFVREFGSPLPVVVIAEMLGVPSDEFERFHRAAFVERITAFVDRVGS